MKNRDSNALKKKVRRFLNVHYKGLYSSSSFLDELSPYGEVVIIGGLIRDLYLSGSKRYRSDIDLVISTNDVDALDSFLASYNAERNRFGGYGIITGKWRTDIWVLQNTWVSQAGYQPVEKFEDLLKSTFFNWDAVYYNYQSNQLCWGDNYFENIANRFLDINCEPNPNPIGNALRALVAIKKHDAALAPSLANFVAETLNPEVLLQHREYVEEKTSLYYNFDELLNIQNELSHHCAFIPNDPFIYDSSNQLSFELKGKVIQSAYANAAIA